MSKAKWIKAKIEFTYRIGDVCISGKKIHTAQDAEDEVRYELEHATDPFMIDLEFIDKEGEVVGQIKRAQ